MRCCGPSVTVTSDHATQSPACSAFTSEAARSAQRAPRRHLWKLGALYTVCIYETTSVCKVSSKSHNPGSQSRQREREISEKQPGNGIQREKRDVGRRAYTATGPAHGCFRTGVRDHANEVVHIRYYELCWMFHRDLYSGVGLLGRWCYWQECVHQEANQRSRAKADASCLACASPPVRSDPRE